MVEQWAAATRADPTLTGKQPYAAAVNGDLSWLGGAIDKQYAGDESELKVSMEGRRLEVFASGPA